MRSDPQHVASNRLVGRSQTSYQHDHVDECGQNQQRKHQARGPRAQRQNTRGSSDEHRQRDAAPAPLVVLARAQAGPRRPRSLRPASAHWPVVRYRHSRWLQPRSRVWPKFSFPAWEFLCAAHAKASRSSSRRAPQSRRRPLPSMTRANSAVLGCGRLTSGLPALLNPEK